MKQKKSSSILKKFLIINLTVFSVLGLFTIIYLEAIQPALVKELAKGPGVIKERAHLMDIAYKENTEIEDRTIDSHVKRIRKKFKKVDEKFSAIETRYGSGYRWNVS